MLEAMASGLPVFATRHGGIPEAIENKVSGILVNERDHRALADGLIETAKSPDRLRAMGHVASESVAKNFNQTEQARLLEEIYLREIGR
jgi:colanic acid/amylovoran biosynthesis glycosyltransferase